MMKIILSKIAFPGLSLCLTSSPHNLHLFRDSGPSQHHLLRLRDHPTTNQALLMLHDRATISNPNVLMYADHSDPALWARQQAEHNERKKLFMEKILESESKKASHYNVLNHVQYSQLMAQVEAGEKSNTKSQIIRRWRRYAIISVGNRKRLVCRGSGPVRFFLPAEELYDEIHNTHLEVGHGGRDRMLTETSSKYVNVTKEMVNIYLSMCDFCLQKKTRRKKIEPVERIWEVPENVRPQESLTVQVIVAGQDNVSNQGDIPRFYQDIASVQRNDGIKENVNVEDNSFVKVEDPFSLAENISEVDMKADEFERNE